VIFDWFAPGISSTMLSLASTIVPGCVDPYMLMDARTGSELGRGAEAREHFVRCAFCRKSVARVPKRKGRRTMHGSDELLKALTNHITPCAIAALRDVMCRWSIGAAAETERSVVQKVLDDVADAKRCGDLYRRPRVQVFDQMLPILPKPPQSYEARCLETGLALWAHGEPVDWSMMEPLA
jgi:hypothetical protein